MKTKIAYQGVPGAYSHIACRNVFPGQDYISCDTFEIAMDLVQKNQADLAMIPVENSNAGRVADGHFLLPDAGLYINGEYFLRIEHQLLGLPGSVPYPAARFMARGGRSAVKRAPDQP